jgi:hypothetical protein
MERMPLEIAGGSAICAHVAPDSGAGVKLLSFLNLKVAAIELALERPMKLLSLFCEGKVKSKFNHDSSVSEAALASPFTNASISSLAGVIEAIWETLFALATVTAIYLGVASLAGHLNDAQVARNAGIGNAKPFGMMLNARLSNVGRIGDRRTFQFD